TENSSTEGTDPLSCSGFSVQSSLWYSFTPAATGAYTLSLCGSQASATFNVYTGAACGAYASVASTCLVRYGGSYDYSNYDCSDSFSKITPTLTAGTTYRFEIANYYYRD